MNCLQKRKLKKAQTAIEYLLLFAIAAIIVFIGFKTILPKSGEVSTAYFNKVANAIMGEPFNAPAVAVSCDEITDDDCRKRSRGVPCCFDHCCYGRWVNPYLYCACHKSPYYEFTCFYETDTNCQDGP